MLVVCSKEGPPRGVHGRPRTPLGNALDCFLIWHFSGSRNFDKLESLIKRILRFTFNDPLSSRDELFKKAKIASLYTGRLYKILMVVFKSLFVSIILNI